MTKLDLDMATMGSRLDSVLMSVNGDAERSVDIAEDLEDLQRQWQKLSRQYVSLKEELKQDGWLVRFRTYVHQI